MQTNNKFRNEYNSRLQLKNKISLSSYFLPFLLISRHYCGIKVAVVSTLTCPQQFRYIAAQSPYILAVNPIKLYY
jgi:hypothetical protein